jgi:MerR HTH family regulatory protein
MTSEGSDVMSAPEAAQQAGITYRQLDHWERQGWVQASHVDEVSPRRRIRRYGRLDVARLATLRHLAACRFDLAVHGPTVGHLELRPGVLVVAGGDPETIRLIDRTAVADAVTAAGRWSVFDPTDLLQPNVDVAAPATPQRRSA